MKKLIAMLLALVMVLGLAACSQNAAPATTTTTEAAETAPSTDAAQTTTENTASGDKVIKIGVVECLTGDNAAPGTLCKIGAELANELHPTVDIGGETYQVQLVIADCKSDKVEAANCATRLIEKEGCVALMGPAGSGFNLAMGDIVKNAKIPTIVSNATSPLVTVDNPYYFRSCFTNDFHATVMAQYAYDAGYRKIAVVKEITQDAAVDCANRFEELFKGLTGDPDCIVCEVGYNVTDQDYNAQLVTLSQNTFDAIFAPNTAVNLAMMMNQAQDMGLDTNWLAIDSCEVPEFITIGGEAVVDKVYFSSFFDTAVAQTPVTTYLLDEYAKRYDDECSSFVALQYDAYTMLLQAISDAGTTDGDAICKALENIKGFEGATGVLEFDANHNIENLAVVKTVGADGKFTYVATVKP